jgi:Fe-S-cluster-containing hydrogenase component 2
MIGCPTGAIRRANVGDVVEVQEQICIGCGTCASNCPYDAIVMHDTGTTWPDNALPKHLRGTPRAVASKCDLCYTSADGPACVRNCPHHCAFRVSSVAEFSELLTRSKR